MTDHGCAVIQLSIRGPVSRQYRLGVQYSQMDPWVAMESNGEVSSFSQLPQLCLMEANATLGQFNQSAASYLQLAHAYRACEQIQCQWPLASCRKYQSAWTSRAARPAMASSHTNLTLLEYNLKQTRGLHSHIGNFA